MRRLWGPKRYYAMHRHWREFGPPVYISVAAYLELNKPSPRRPPDIAGDPDDPGNLGELMSRFPGGAL